jgi:hypothetical protein
MQEWEAMTKTQLQLDQLQNFITRCNRDDWWAHTKSSAIWEVEVSKTNVVTKATVKSAQEARQFWEDNNTAPWDMCYFPLPDTWIVCKHWCCPLRFLNNLPRPYAELHTIPEPGEDHHPITEAQWSIYCCAHGPHVQEEDLVPHPPCHSLFWNVQRLDTPPSSPGAAGAAFKFDNEPVPLAPLVMTLPLHSVLGPSPPSTPPMSLVALVSASASTTHKDSHHQLHMRTVENG